MVVYSLEASIWKIDKVASLCVVSISIFTVTKVGSMVGVLNSIAEVIDSWTFILGSAISRRSSIDWSRDGARSKHWWA
jgi:hypothetical protein